MKKQCLKCGAVRATGARQRRCKVVERRFGSAFYCWGQLRVVPELPRSSDKPKATAQQLATRKLEHARKMIREKTRAMKRITTSLRLWERRATYYARRASMTDAEVEAERTKRHAQAKQRTRSRSGRAIRVED